MAGAYGTPCSGELQFWTVVQNSMRELAKQTTRIANALEAGHVHEERPPAVDSAKLYKALDELVANLEKASARDVFSIIDRKVLLDAKAALAATAAELGSAAKEPPAEPRVLKVLFVDDFPGMRGYIEKHVPDVEVTYCTRLPDDESVFAQYDALVIDGDGVGNRTYPDGLAFCKAYDKPENQAVVFHSGLSASGADARELEWRGVANLPKGYPEKLARCIRFPMPKLIGGTDKKPAAFKVGDRVSWTDPDTGRKTDGWTVLDAPETPDDDAVYTIEDDNGFKEEARARELSYPEGRPL